MGPRWIVVRQFELILPYGSRDCAFAVENGAKIRHLPHSAVLGHYLAKLTFQSKVLSVRSLALIYGWTAMWLFERKLHVESREDVFLPKSEPDPTLTPQNQVLGAILPK